MKIRKAYHVLYILANNHASVSAINRIVRPILMGVFIVNKEKDADSIININKVNIY